MNDRIEQFIRDHREEFDSDEPAPKVWEKIDQKMKSGEEHPVPVRNLPLGKWAVAAAAVLVLGSGVWLLSRTNTPAQLSAASPQAGKSSAAQADRSSPGIAGTDGKDTQAALPGKPDSGATVNRTNPSSEDLANISEEMYHYAKLVEIKQKELKKIQRDEPLLYKQFVGDVNKLDSVYHSLEYQLTQNPNREQLLEAMIQNLQLQMNLLNHQLDIIKQINHSKKSAYEEAYKSA
jgi:hypothetical protein